MRSTIIKGFIYSSFMIFLSGYTCELNAQAFDFRSLTVSEGLPHGQISDIHHARNGFVWIGTAASGIARFDGTSYQIYDVSSGLKDDMITTLFEDSDENLWVATYGGGVSQLQGDQFIHPFEGHPLDEADVLSILEAPNGHVWFTTFDSGIYIFDGENLRQISEDDGLISNAVWDVHWDENGTIWIATHYGFSIMDGSSFENYGEQSGISGAKIFKIINHEGVKWMATSRGITRFDGESFSNITEINGRQLHYVYDIIKASDGRIWIGMENNGLYWFEEGEFTHITRAEGLVSNYIYRFYEDRNQNIWIATDERGISIFRGEGFRFFNAGNGLINSEVLSLFKDDDHIWVGTANGLQVYDEFKFKELIIPDSLSDEKYIWDIEKLQNGSFLLLVDYSKILEFDGVAFHDYSRRLGLDNWAFDLKTDRNGILWIGTDYGLIRYDGEEKRTFGTEDGLPGPVIYHIFESREGVIWVATNRGVGRFNGESFDSISIDEGLGHYNVNYITQDSLGEYWIGTSAGVTHYIPASEGDSAKVRNFGKTDGMKLVETLFLWFDEHDQLWQGTNGGLHHFDVAEYRETGRMKIEHHRLSNHGIGVETMHKAAITHSDGKAWFGTMNGILIVDPEMPRTGNSSPEVLLEEILLNGMSVPFREDSHDANEENNRKKESAAEFAYGNNTFTFSYASLEYLYPEKTQFRYKLEGFDTDWSTPSENRKSTYTNLSPGNYRFLVQAKNSGDEWGEESAGYSFSIAFPFWHTYWFWGLVLAGAGFVIAGFIRIRLNHLERDKLNSLVDQQTQTLREALEEKEVLIKEVHHRVKNNLAVIYSLLDLQSNYIQDEFALAVFEDSKLRISSIALIHEKLYQNESLSKIEARKYIPELISVITKSMNSRQKKIDLSIDVDDVNLSIDQGIPCGLILNELVSNAYKHAFSDKDNGNVDIHFRQQNGHVILKVQDDGKGLPEGFNIGNSDSLGLILVNTLSNQLKADLNISSNGVGSSFEIKFERDQT